MAEGTHEIGVALNWGPTVEDWESIAAEGDVLEVPATPLIGVS